MKFLKFLFFFCVLNLYAQESSIDKNKAIAHYCNSVKQLFNSYNNALEVYSSNLSNTQALLKEYKKNPARRPYYLSCKEEFLIHHKTIAKLKDEILNPPPFLPHQKVIVTNLKKSFDHFNIISENCSKMSSYVSSKTYLKEDDFKTYNNLYKSSRFSYFECVESFTKVFKYLNKLAVSSEPEIAKTDPVNQWIGPMKKDLKTAGKILDYLFDGKNDMLKRLAIVEENQMESKKDTQKKDLKALKDIYYRSVYEDFYREYERYIKLIRSKAESDNQKVSLSPLLIGYNDMVESYNKLINSYPEYGFNQENFRTHMSKTPVSQMVFDIGKVTQKRPSKRVKSLNEIFDYKNTTAETSEPKVKKDLKTLDTKLKENIRKGKLTEALTNIEDYTALQVKYLDEVHQKELAILKAEEKEKELKLLKDKAELQAVSNKKNIYIIIGLILLILVSISLGFIYIQNQRTTVKSERLSLEMRLFRSQMDPHFIFNALSNIQTNILKKENDMAFKYLVKFAKLLRHNLQNTSLNSILISEEIKSIYDYLELQKLRLGNDFNYRIEIHDTIEQDMLKIPAMLIQPIVENAVEHGVEGVENAQINIDIADMEDYIECIITDNGRGYSNTVEHRNPHKKSFATNIIRERLAILSKKTKLTLNYFIEDLKSEDGSIAGSKAVIRLPLLTSKV